MIYHRYTHGHTWTEYESWADAHAVALDATRMDEEIARAARGPFWTFRVEKVRRRWTVAVYNGLGRFVRRW